MTAERVHGSHGVEKQSHKCRRVKAGSWMRMKEEEKVRGLSGASAACIKGGGALDLHKRRGRVGFA
jgi:hypothetical protein